MNHLPLQTHPVDARNALGLRRLLRPIPGLVSAAVVLVLAASSGRPVAAEGAENLPAPDVQGAAILTNQNTFRSSAGGSMPDVSPDGDVTLPVPMGEQRLALAVYPTCPLLP